MIHSAPPLGVAIVDRDAIVRDALAAFLSMTGDLNVVHLAEGPSQIVAALRREPVDVVLMDVTTSPLETLRATARITSEHAQTKVLLMSSSDNDSLRDALAAGASGFMAKETRPEGFADAIRTVSGGSLVLAPDAICQLLSGWEPPSQSPSAAELDITTRELTMLRLLCEGLSNGEIGNTMYLSESTVKTYLSRLFVKLGVSTRLRATVRARTMGLLDAG